MMLSDLTKALSHTNNTQTLTPSSMQLIVDVAHLHKDAHLLYKLAGNFTSVPDSNQKVEYPDADVLAVLWSSPLLIDLMCNFLMKHKWLGTAVGRLRTAAACAAVLRRMPDLASPDDFITVSGVVLRQYVSGHLVGPKPTSADHEVMVAAAKQMFSYPDVVLKALTNYDSTTLQNVTELAGSGLTMWRPALKLLSREECTASTAFIIWRNLGKDPSVIDLLPILDLSAVPLDKLVEFYVTILKRLAALLPSESSREIFEQLSSEWEGTIRELALFAVNVTNKSTSSIPSWESIMDT